MDKPADLMTEEEKSWLDKNEKFCIWADAMLIAEQHYNTLIEMGCKPQEARDVLPTSVKADIVMTANLNEWKHIFNLRACDSTGPAHPQMAEVMRPLLRDMREKYNFAFGDMVMPDEIIS